ncbi:MAG: hypothetical protein AAFR38_12970 [Planctomycetota bacterium]
MRVLKVQQLVACVLGTLWAVFWIIFAVLSALTGSGADVSSGIGPALGFVLLIGAPAAILWWRPRVGATLLVLAGTFAAYSFDDPWAFGMLAAPAVAIGLLALLAPAQAGLAGQAGRTPR